MRVIKMTRMDSHRKLSGLHCQTTALYTLSLSEPQSDRCANTIPPERRNEPLAGVLVYRPGRG